MTVGTLVMRWLTTQQTATSGDWWMEKEKEDYAYGASSGPSLAWLAGKDPQREPETSSRKEAEEERASLLMPE